MGNVQEMAGIRPVNRHHRRKNLVAATLLMASGAGLAAGCTLGDRSQMAWCQGHPVEAAQAPSCAGATR